MAGKVVLSTLNDSSGVLATQNGMTGIAKAWVNFNGSNGASPVVRSSFNISSVTRNSTGYYTVNITTAMANANYCISASTGSGSPTPIMLINASSFNTAVTPTTTAFALATLNAATGSGADILYISASVFSS